MIDTKIETQNSKKILKVFIISFLALGIFLSYTWFFKGDKNVIMRNMYERAGVSSDIFPFEHVPGEIMIFFKQGTTPEQVRSLVKELGGNIKEEIGTTIIFDKNGEEISREKKVSSWEQRTPFRVLVQFKNADDSMLFEYIQITEKNQHVDLVDVNGLASIH